MKTISKEELVSDCCSAPMNGVLLDMLLCPTCGEHCGVVDLAKEDAADE